MAKSLLELLLFYMLKTITTLFMCVPIATNATEMPEGVVYCHGKTALEYRLVNPKKMWLLQRWI